MNKTRIPGRLADYRIALRSLVVEASHYLNSKYPAIAYLHLEESLRRARRVLRGGAWEPRNRKGGA